MSAQYTIAAIGSVNDKSTYSGTPYHFYATALKEGLNFIPWEMDLSKLKMDRRLWNMLKLLTFQQPGGYQYTERFSGKLLSQIPPFMLSGNIISFNQHFPPANRVNVSGGKIYYYIDATFKQLLDRYGVARQVGRKIREEGLKREKEFFHMADKIFTMQHWAMESVVNDYSVPREKVSAILPGANILFDDNYYAKPLVAGQFSKERPLVLGFVGKDWKRKGLLVLEKVREILERRGFYVTIRCAGYAPRELQGRKGIEFAGFINKYPDYTSFIRFLESCDIGCLYSDAEFSSISILEFISVGRPVAGFVVDGMGELLMEGLSLRHKPSDSIERIADDFENFIVNEKFRNGLASAAVEKSDHVRWKRCLAEMTQLLDHA